MARAIAAQWPNHWATARCRVTSWCVGLVLGSAVSLAPAWAQEDKDSGALHADAEGAGAASGASTGTASTGTASTGTDDTDADAESSPFVVHGFVSQGALLSTKNNYLAESKRGSVEFSEVGLNVTKDLSENLSTGVQLFAHELGPLGNYQPQFDWFYLDYHWRDWLGVRVGRIKVPYGLYNEINDVDVARQPILLPQSIYPVDHREYLFAQTGAELYGNLPLGPAGSLEYRVYGGTLPSEPSGSPPPTGVTVTNIEVPYLLGGRALWETPVDGLHTGLSLQTVRFDADYNFSPEVLSFLQAVMFVPADVTSPISAKFKVTRWVGSLAYSAHDFDLSLEYSRLLGEFDSKAPVLLPPHTLNERYYAMASYRVNNWFSPGIYYSGYYPNIRERHGRSAYQHDLALSLRYDLTDNWLFKLEGHYMRGTAALENRGLNHGVEPRDLDPTWGLFLLKTTAYF